MLTAFFSFIGVIIGATLQYVFTRHIEHQKHIRDLRSKAYMDYLKCVCEIANFRPKENSKEKLEINMKIADSKARICLYGSKEAIESFALFEQLGAGMITREQREAFTNMVKTMRTDSGGEINVKSLDLEHVLFGIHD